MIKNKKLTLTVGITTCYGDKSIINTVKSIRSQRGIDHFRFILVADRVPIKLGIKKDLKKYQVELIENKEEGSQIKKQKQILALCNTDLIIFTQDDVLYKPDAFSVIVRQFNNDQNITLISVRNQHLQPLTFFEDILNVGTRIANRIASYWRDGDNYLACIGRCMAFRTEWLKRKIKVPEEVTTTDAFYYFSNKFMGGKFKYLGNIEVLFRNPQNMTEHLRKSSRFQYSQHEMSRYFSNLGLEYKIPRFILVKSILEEIVNNPIKTLIYFVVNRYTKVKRLGSSKVLNPIWEVDLSTKSIS